MLGTTHKKRRGYSLVELLVVMAIIVILASLAVPAMNQLGAFGGNDLQRASRELYALLSAAKIYAATHRVDTAVVYAMDEPGTPVIVDSVTGNTVRAIRSAAVMYALPVQYGTDKGRFVPVPYGKGSFKDLPALTVILLYDEDSKAPIYGYNPARTPYSLVDDTDPGDSHNVNFGIATLGMRMVEAYLDPDVDDNGAVVFGLFVPLPAHVFKPEGRLDPSTPSDGREYPEKERYTILVAPSPDEGWERRLIDMDNPNLSTIEGTNNLMVIPIEIFKSTARLRIAS